MPPAAAVPFCEGCHGHEVAALGTPAAARLITLRAHTPVKLEHLPPSYLCYRYL